MPKNIYGIVDYTSLATMEIVRDWINNQQPITINTIDRMKYKELKQILINIKKLEQLNFDYDNLLESSDVNIRKLG